jgi:uncharacterized damage-inducible protein DinB
MTEKSLIIGELKREGASTRKMLERLSEESFSFKPHEKSFSTIALATHIANLPIWISMILDTDGLDLANPLPRQELAKTTEELLGFFDKRIADVTEALDRVDEAELGKMWLLTKGEFTIANAPKKIIIRYFALNHMVHHRGQLSVYLRLLGIPVPGMYGPSADEA